MRIVNLNPADDIGASSWFVGVDGFNLLMDAGAHPKLDGYAATPMYDLIKNEEVDAIAISHCHHDHVGTLPMAVRRFPAAHVLMSELSGAIVDRILHNSVNVMSRQRDELGIKEYPLFTHREVEGISPDFHYFPYFREIEWASIRKIRMGLRSPTLEFLDAGHTLGSSGIYVRTEEGSLFYTGDVCFQDQTLLKGARFDDMEVDTLILETTRGNREPTPGFTREEELERLVQAIENTLDRKGSVLIPAFALGRTQEILALLALLMKEGRLKRQPVFIGGLGRVFTEIYDQQAKRTHRNHPNLKLTQDLNIVVLDRNQLDSMRLTGGRIFVITAGMLSENTGSHELAARMMEDERHGIFFVGYTDPDTPGGRLRESVPGEPFFYSNPHGELVRNCEMLNFDLTAHAHREELLEFAIKLNPKNVILGHGDKDSRDWFEGQLRAHAPKIKVFQPGSGECVEV